MNPANGKKKQLERIRDIRSSERRFYQKITDIYSQCSADYDVDSPVTKEFFATVQNKLHYAVTHHTAAEIVYGRADSTRPNIGLATWKNAPHGRIRKSDVSIAKNYLNKEDIMHDKGKVTAVIAKAFADAVHAAYPFHLVSRFERFSHALLFCHIGNNNFYTLIAGSVNLRQMLEQRSVYHIIVIEDFVIFLPITAFQFITNELPCFEMSVLQYHNQSPQPNQNTAQQGFYGEFFMQEQKSQY